MTTLQGIVSRILGSPHTHLFGLLGLVFALYLPGLNGPFLFDDFSNILRNPRVQIETFSWKGFSDAAFSSTAGPLQRPLAMASFALNYLGTGLTPFAFKITNLAFHLSNSVLIFLLTRSLLDRACISVDPLRSGSRSSQSSLALFITALWALHPMQVSTVLYVVQRMTLIAAFFTLLAVLLYVQSRQYWLQTGDSRGFWWRFLGVVVAGGVGLLGKESAVLLPILLLVVEMTFFRFEWPRVVSSRHGSGLLWMLALPSMFILGYLVYVGMQGLTQVGDRNFNSLERLLTQSRIGWDYVYRLVSADTSAMSFYNDTIVTSYGLLQPTSTLPAIAAWIGLLGTSIWLAVDGRAPALVFGALWFVGGHLLESTTLLLEMAFEHRNYLPSYGVAFAVGSAIFWVLDWAKVRQRLQLALLLSVVLSLGLQLHTRTVVWSNPTRFFNHEIEVHPESARAWSDLAAFMNMANMPVEDVLPYLEKAITLNPREAGYPIMALHLQLYASDRGQDIERLAQLAIDRLSQYPITAFGTQTLINLAMHAVTTRTPDTHQNWVIKVLRTSLKGQWVDKGHKKIIQNSVGYMENPTHRKPMK